jgi:hypothetical protein
MEDRKFKLELTGWEMSVLHSLMDNMYGHFNNEDTKQQMKAPEKTVSAFNSILSKIETIYETL